MRMSKMVLVVCSMVLLSAYRNLNSENDNKEQNTINSAEKENDSKEERGTVTIKTSPDKYTWYIKDYVGKNVASFGYTSMGGHRMDAQCDAIYYIDRFDRNRFIKDRDNFQQGTGRKKKFCQV